MQILLISLFSICYAHAGEIPLIVSGPTSQWVSQDVLGNFGLTGAYGLPFPSLTNLTGNLKEIEDNVKGILSAFEPWTLALAAPVSTTAKVAISLLHYRIRDAVEWSSAHLLNVVYFLHHSVQSEFSRAQTSVDYVLNGKFARFCSGIYTIEQITQSKCVMNPLNEEQKTVLLSYLAMVNKLQVAEHMMIDLLNKDQLTVLNFYKIFEGWSSAEKVLAIQTIQDLWCNHLKNLSLVKDYTLVAANVLEQLNLSLDDLHEKIVYHLENQKNYLRADYLVFPKNDGSSYN